jgi:hypothetical protein
MLQNNPKEPSSASVKICLQKHPRERSLKRNSMEISVKPFQQTVKARQSVNGIFGKLSGDITSRQHSVLSLHLSTRLFAWSLSSWLPGLTTRLKLSNWSRLPNSRSTLSSSILRSCSCSWMPTSTNNLSVLDLPEAVIQILTLDGLLKLETLLFTLWLSTLFSL